MIFVKWTFNKEVNNANKSVKIVPFSSEAEAKILPV
jgi:hypothetical protein